MKTVHKIGFTLFVLVALWAAFVSVRSLDELTHSSQVVKISKLNSKFGPGLVMIGVPGQHFRQEVTIASYKTLMDADPYLYRDNRDGTIRLGLTYKLKSNLLGLLVASIIGTAFGAAVMQGRRRVVRAT